MEDENLSSILSILENAIPEYQWAFDHINSSGGLLVLPKSVISFLTEVEQPPWAVYYEHPERLFSLALFALKSKEEVERISKDVALLSEQEKLAYKANMHWQVLANQAEFDARINSSKILASEDLAATLDSMSPEQRDDELAFGYYFTNCFVTGTFQFLSSITFGRDMCQLVQAAKKGDDDAFCKAIQIDKTVLFAIPYFRQRLSKLQLSGDRQLLDAVSRAIKGKILNQRIDFPELRFVFALLHYEGYLERISNDQLLDIVNQLGVYESDDVNALSKMKNKFLKRQGTTI